MPDDNREWKRFSRRWMSWRWLTLFVVLSVGLHVALGFFLDLSVDATGKEQRHEALDEVKFAPRSAVVRTSKAAAPSPLSPVQKETLKKELAAGQLRDLFDDLVGDSLPPAEAESLWTRMTAFLAPDLDELALIVAEAAPADERAKQSLGALAGSAILAHEAGHKPDVQIQVLRGRMVEAMYRQAVKERNQSVSDALVQQARDVSTQLVEHFKKDLTEKLGHVAGEKLNVLRETDATTRVHALETADAAFLQTARLARQTADAHVKLSLDVKENYEGLLAAREKKNNALANQFAAAIRDYRPIAGATHLALGHEVNLLHSPVVKLADLPGLGTSADETLRKLEESIVDSYAVIQAMGTLESGKLLVALQKAAETSRACARSAENVRSAILLQMLREQVDQRQVATALLGRRAEQIARIQAEAEQTKDAAKSLVAEREYDLLTRETIREKDAIDQLEIRLAKIEGLAQSCATQLLAIQDTADAVRQELRKADDALAKRQSDGAAIHLREVSVQLGRVDTGLMAAQEKLGVKKAPNPAALARRQIEKMLKSGKLLASAKEQFETYYRASIKEKVLARFQEGVAKRLKVEQGIDPNLAKSVGILLDRAFDRELLLQIPIEKTVAQAIESKLPPPTTNEIGPEVEDGLTAGGAQQIVERVISYVLPGFNYSAVGSAALYKYVSTVPKASPQSQFLNQMHHLHERLATGRRDFLGAADLTALAAARRHALEDGTLENNLGQTPIRPAIMMAARDGLAVNPGAQVRKLPAIENSNRFAAAPYRVGAMPIDGNLDKWKDAPFFFVEGVLEGKNPGKAKTSTQKVWVAHCNQGLLVAVNVADSTAKLENDRPLSTFWLNDAVEVFVDTLNAKYQRRNDGDVHQFFAFPFGHKDDPLSGGFEVRPGSTEAEMWTRTAHAPQVIRRAALKTQTGWSMELLIPKSLLGSKDFTPGRLIGFNLQIDTGSDTYYYFTTKKKFTPSKRPDFWGDLLLLGTDARIEALDAVGTPVNLLCPGQPVRIRVTDFDMNADPASREKIAATVRTDAGELETVILEETDANSGVFEAMLATRLETGSRLLGTLDVNVGGQVTIEYVDQIRAFGEQNVRLKTTVAVGLIGKRFGK